MPSIAGSNIEMEIITNSHFELITEGLFLIIAFKPMNKKTIAYKNKRSGRTKNR
jgi:hypothetical protein